MKFTINFWQAQDWTTFLFIEKYIYHSQFTSKFFFGLHNSYLLLNYNNSFICIKRALNFIEMSILNRNYLMGIGEFYNFFLKYINIYKYFNLFNLKYLPNGFLTNYKKFFTIDNIFRVKKLKESKLNIVKYLTKSKFKSNNFFVEKKRKIEFDKDKKKIKLLPPSVIILFNISKSFWILNQTKIIKIPTIGLVYPKTELNTKLIQYPIPILQGMDSNFLLDVEEQKAITDFEEENAFIEKKRKEKKRVLKAQGFLVTEEKELEFLKNYQENLIEIFFLFLFILITFQSYKKLLLKFTYKSIRFLKNNKLIYKSLVFNKYGYKRFLLSKKFYKKSFIKFFIKLNSRIPINSNLLFSHRYINYTDRSLVWKTQRYIKRVKRIRLKWDHIKRRFTLEPFRVRKRIRYYSIPKYWLQKKYMIKFKSFDLIRKFKNKNTKLVPFVSTLIYRNLVKSPITRLYLNRHRLWNKKRYSSEYYKRNDLFDFFYRILARSKWKKFKYKRRQFVYDNFGYKKVLFQDYTVEKNKDFLKFFGIKKPNFIPPYLNKNKNKSFSSFNLFKLYYYKFKFNHKRFEWFKNLKSSKHLLKYSNEFRNYFDAKKQNNLKLKFRYKIKNILLHYVKQNPQKKYNIVNFINSKLKTNSLYKKKLNFLKFYSARYWWIYKKPLLNLLSKFKFNKQLIFYFNLFLQDYKFRFFNLKMLKSNSAYYITNRDVNFFYRKLRRFRKFYLSRKFISQERLYPTRKIKYNKSLYNKFYKARFRYINVEKFAKRTKRHKRKLKAIFNLLYRKRIKYILINYKNIYNYGQKFIDFHVKTNLPTLFTDSYQIFPGQDKFIPTLIPGTNSDFFSKYVLMYTRYYLFKKRSNPHQQFRNKANEEGISAESAFFGTHLWFYDRLFRLKKKKDRYSFLYYFRESQLNLNEYFKLSTNYIKQTKNFFYDKKLYHKLRYNNIIERSVKFNKEREEDEDYYLLNYRKLRVKKNLKFFFKSQNTYIRYWLSAVKNRKKIGINQTKFNINKKKLFFSLYKLKFKSKFLTGKLLTLKLKQLRLYNKFQLNFYSKYWKKKKHFFSNMINKKAKINQSFSLINKLKIYKKLNKNIKKFMFFSFLLKWKKRFILSGPLKDTYNVAKIRRFKLLDETVPENLYKKKILGNFYYKPNIKSFFRFYKKTNRTVRYLKNNYSSNSLLKSLSNSLLRKNIKNSKLLDLYINAKYKDTSKHVLIAKYLLQSKTLNSRKYNLGYQKSVWKNLNRNKRNRWYRKSIVWKKNIFKHKFLKLKYRLKRKKKWKLKYQIFRPRKQIRIRNTVLKEKYYKSLRLFRIAKIYNQLNKFTKKNLDVFLSYKKNAFLKKKFFLSFKKHSHLFALLRKKRILGGLIKWKKYLSYRSKDRFNKLNSRFNIIRLIILRTLIKNFLNKKYNAKSSSNHLYNFLNYSLKKKNLKLINLFFINLKRKYYWIKKIFKLREEDIFDVLKIKSDVTKKKRNERTLIRIKILNRHFQKSMSKFKESSDFWHDRIKKQK